MGLTLKAIIALDGVNCRNQGILGQGGGRRDILEQISLPVLFPRMEHYIDTHLLCHETLQK